MIHFRMELYGIKASLPVLHAGYRAVIRMSRDHKAFRRAADVVGMTHPARVDIVSSCQYTSLVIYSDFGAAIFACRSGIDAAAETISHELRSVAYAEHRDAQRENAIIYRRRTLSIGALRSSRKYYSTRAELTYVCRIDFIVIMYFRVDPAFSYAAGDQLVILTSEVYYKDPVPSHCFLLPNPQVPV